MIWRLLVRSWARIRDLGLLALLADYLLHGLGGWVALSAGIGIAALLTAAMATAATTASKAANTEQRVNALVGSVSNLSGKNTAPTDSRTAGLNGHSDLAGLLDGTVGGRTGDTGRHRYRSLPLGRGEWRHPRSEQRAALPHGRDLLRYKRSAQSHPAERLTTGGGEPWTGRALVRWLQQRRTALTCGGLGH